MVETRNSLIYIYIYELKLREERESVETTRRQTLETLTKAKPFPKAKREYLPSTNPILQQGTLWLTFTEHVTGHRPTKGKLT